MSAYKKVQVQALAQAQIQVQCISNICTMNKVPVQGLI